MNKISKFILILAVPVLLLGISSCKSTRYALKQPLKEYDYNYLYAKMLENHLEFNYLKAKFNISYREDKKKTNLVGQLRMKNDSITWIAFSASLGINAARVLLTNDSIKFINQINKKFFKGEYRLLDSLLNTTIDYSILQSMIIGNDLTQYDVNKYRASIDGGLYRITIQERKKIKEYLRGDDVESRVLVQNIWLDPENFRIRKVDLKELNDDNNKKLEVVYDDYIKVGDQLFPNTMKITIQSQKTIFIDVDFLKVELDEPLSFPFRIPKKYKNLL